MKHTYYVRIWYIYVQLFADPTANLVTPGPYGLIFASFVPFFFDIPVSTRFRVFSFFFSDKSFIYLAGIQVLINLIMGAYFITCISRIIQCLKINLNYCSFFCHHGKGPSYQECVASLLVPCTVWMSFTSAKQR